jgi:hypothetical protein
MANLENNIRQDTQLKMQLVIHKTLGDVAFLIGAGLGLLTCLLGCIGGLLILVISKHSGTAWTAAIIGILDGSFILWLGIKAEKRVSQLNDSLKQKVIENF